eukprot:987367_1
MIHHDVRAIRQSIAMRSLYVYFQFKHKLTHTAHALTMTMETPQSVTQKKQSQLNAHYQSLSKRITSTYPQTRSQYVPHCFWLILSNVIDHKLHEKQCSNEGKTQPKCKYLYSESYSLNVNDVN